MNIQVFVMIPKETSKIKINEFASRALHIPGAGLRKTSGTYLNENIAMFNDSLVITQHIKWGSRLGAPISIW